MRKTSILEWLILLSLVVIPFQVAFTKLHADDLIVRPGTVVFDLSHHVRPLDIINTTNSKLSWQIKQNRSRCSILPTSKGTLDPYGIDHVSLKNGLRKPKKDKQYQFQLYQDGNPVKTIDVLRVKYRLPEDQRLHLDSLYQTTDYIGWLYFTGTVRDQTSDALYGYEFNIFQSWVEELGGFVYKTDIAISDVEGQKFHFDSLFSFEEGSVRFDSTRMELVWEFLDEDLTIRHWEQTDVWEIQAVSGKETGEQFAIDLRLDNIQQDYYPETADGIIKMGEKPEGDESNMLGLSYYYTHPNLNTAGTLTIGEKQIEVYGSTWYDHQWGNFARCPTNWDWFSLRLDDGLQMMLFNFNKPGDNQDPETDLRTITCFNANGELYHQTGEKAFTPTPLREYTSPTNGKTFRVDWRLDTPFGAFYLTPYIEDQVVDDEEDPYYEGIMKVREDSVDGEIIGLGYLETSFEK